MLAHNSLHCRLEFGHNFGSDHDSRVMAENPECSPEEGGKYLMFPASISGEKPNNKVSFSARKYIWSEALCAKPEAKDGKLKEL